MPNPAVSAILCEDSRACDLAHALHTRWGMNTTARSVSTNLELGHDHVEAHASAMEEPLDALATKVFFYTLAYVAIFVTVAVLLVG